MLWAAVALQYTDKEVGEANGFGMSPVTLLADFCCGSDAVEQTALKIWFGWKNISLFRSNLEWHQELVVEVAAAGTSAYEYLVQEDTNDDLVEVANQRFDPVHPRNVIFNFASFLQLCG